MQRAKLFAYVVPSTAQIRAEGNNTTCVGKKRFNDSVTHGLRKKYVLLHWKIHEARAFNFTYRYIDDVLSINNSRFSEFLPLIYPPELEVKETTDTASSA